MSDAIDVTTSPTVGELFGALAKAQGVMEGAKKDAQNPHLRSKYADLASVWEACRKALSSHGLCVVQTTEEHGKDGVMLITTLGHSSGEWIRGRMYMPVDKQNAHGFGSALTYARRYALSSIVGVAPEDDDGAAAVNTPKPQNGPLEKKLAESVDILTRAAQLRDQIGAAKNKGDMNEVMSIMNDLKQGGLAPAEVAKLIELKDQKKKELGL